MRIRFGTQMAIVLPALLLAGGCGPDVTMPMMVATPPAEASETPGDYVVTRVGVFGDGLAYHGRRGIYEIVDKRTGRRFLGVSGIGISELGAHTEGKNTIPDER